MAYNDDPIMNQNKGYGQESVKQERHNLMNDNPVAKDASGGRDGSWMSKHSQSRMGGGSPLKAAKPKPDFIDADGDGDRKESMRKALQEKKEQ
jgi:hypothetical protein